MRPLYFLKRCERCTAKRRDNKPVGTLGSISTSRSRQLLVSVIVLELANAARKNFYFRFTCLGCGEQRIEKVPRVKDSELSEWEELVDAIHRKLRLIPAIRRFNTYIGKRSTGWLLLSSLGLAGMKISLPRKKQKDVRR